MANIFSDDFAPPEELTDGEEFVLASGDDCVKAQNKEQKENVEQNEKNGDDMNVNSASQDSSNSKNTFGVFEKLASSDYVQDRPFSSIGRFRRLRRLMPKLKSKLKSRMICADSLVEQLYMAESKEQCLSAISRMCKLGDDEELLVRSEAIPCLPFFALFCKDNPEDLNAVIRQQLVPYTVKLLTDEELVTRKIGHRSLKIFLENNLLDNSQLNDWICPLISELVTFGTTEELRAESVSGMCKMIPFIGKEITEKFFLSPFISLCCDSSFTIRKVCTIHFGSICKVFETGTVESTLLPAFLNLCNDEIWGIRKECADVFVDVASTVTEKTRREILTHIFISLLDGESRYVKVAAYQSLGGFIATFADPSQMGWQNWNQDRKEQFITRQKFKQLCLNWNLSMQDNLNSEEISNYTRNLELEAKFKCISELDSSLSEDNVHNKCRTIKYPKKWTDPDKNFNINVEINDRNTETNLINQSQFPVNEHKTTDVNNTNVFNNFQFWRTPLPEVELELEFEPDKRTNLNLADSTTAVSSEFSSITHTVPDMSDYLPSKSVKVDEVLNTVTFCTSSKVKENDEFQEKPNKLSNAKSRTTEDMTIYDQDIVPFELLGKFLSGVHYEENTPIFAYGFPAVAYTLGREYWPCIRHVCFLLAEDLKDTVRRTVASFLHELAAFLDHDIIIKDLLPIFFNMSQDDDYVRIKVVEYLARFLLHLTPLERRKFLPFIGELLIIESENNWRFRFTVAEQLVHCVTLFHLSDVKASILPVCLTLMNDKACDVRRAAIKMFAVIIKSFLESSTSTYKEEVFYLLETYVDMHKQERKWLQRQKIVFICQELASQRSLPNELYVEKVVPSLFSLAWDPVPNVRLAVARCLSLTLIPLGYLPGIQKFHYQLLLQVMYSLQSDVDRDVRHFAHLSAGAFNVLPQKKLSPV